MPRIAGRKLLAAGAMLAGLGSGAPAAAHGASANDLPVTPQAVRLRHLRGADLISLFSRPLAPDPQARVPRAVRPDSSEALLPAGIEGLLRGEESGTLILVGREDRFAELRSCVEVLDAPLKSVGPDRFRVILTLHKADARTLRGRIHRLVGGGTAATAGQTLTLEGSRSWLHRALREVIRAELHLEEPDAPPVS